MFCSWGERAPPPGVTVSLIITPLYLTGHGDQRDVSSKNSEGSGGWSDSRDEGTGGHHWVHQARADSKSASPAEPLLYGLLGVNWWDTASLKSWLKEGQGYLCLLFWTKQGSFLFFSPLLSVQLLSFPFPLSPCRFLTALIKVWVAGTGSVRKEEDFKSLFFCNLPLILIGGPLAWEEALPRIAAKAKFNTVYLTPNYTATHICSSLVYTFCCCIESVCTSAFLLWECSHLY